MTVQPGDLCYFKRVQGSDLLVLVHTACHEHGEGIVTNPATGNVLGHVDTMRLKEAAA